MENIINVHVEKLPEGYYLVTSEDVQGLVAQGRTVSEALELARDVTRRLLESQSKKNNVWQAYNSNLLFYGFYYFPKDNHRP